MFAVEDRASANEKHSSKGIGHYALTKQCKEREMSVTELYKSILDGGRTLPATNKGIGVFNSKLFTYEQSRNALTSFYCKRRVFDDGVSTEPLSITLEAKY